MRNRCALFVITLAFALVLTAQTASAQQPANETWRFLVSGDSRNCGDVVMPGIAETAKKNQAAFYWHLGDLRRTSGVDEDIAHQPEHIAKPLDCRGVRNHRMARLHRKPDQPFGSIPFFLGIGNHETVPPL